LHCEIPAQQSIAAHIPKAIEYELLRPERETRRLKARVVSYRNRLGEKDLDTPLILSKHSPIPSILKPPKPKLLLNTPTIYILTFSTDLTPPSSLLTLLHTHLPPRNPPIPFLYTIDARDFLVPHPRLCREYSGLAAQVQEVVLGDVRARAAVERAVGELVGFVRECGGSEREREVCMAVCCTGGTHRSVAIAEAVARGVVKRVGGVEGRGKGVKVVVRHVHRVRGGREEF
jgi:hypothetical protein